ncbi:glycosyl hydrolase [Pontibacter korlensis]|uniref:glycosyl hydrolase n=1 Tax=Pontibacter korlensis TaxID=400092 RepID=UPI00069712FB|nr:glycosyl hydrolase [Pontibacter korlensis]
MRYRCYSFLFISILLSITIQAYAQKYEAENATLTGGATRQACSSCSGGYFVAQGEGKLSFNVTLPQSGFYTLVLRASAPNGDKTNIVAVNETTTDFILGQSNTYASHKVVHTLKLESGQHTIEIRKSWGWINIDYIELEKVDASERFNLNQALVTPNPTPEAKALYDFLLDHYGKKVISGAMTLDSLDEAMWLKQHTGKEPALLGIDFMHSGRGYTWYEDKMPIINARTWYSRNGIPAIMWHWRDPLRSTEEFYTQNDSKPNGTNFDISQISDENSAEYEAMLKDIDYIAGLLKELQEQHVPVVWRPLHEAAGGWFWWGAKGPEPLKALWRLMYDRMVNHHGLRNLIWVWTREPGDDAWYPGDAYVDIVGRDMYKDGDHSSHQIEFNNMNALYGGKKMVTLSEVGSYPDPDNLLQDGAGWSWFMPWYGGYTRDSKYNTVELWRKTMAHDYVLTLDEMPDLSTYTRQSQEPTGIEDELAKKQPVIAYPTIVNHSLTVRSERELKTLVVYNLLGTVVRQQKVTGHEAVISLAGLAPGVYLVQVNSKHVLRVLKQ